MKDNGFKLAKERRRRYPAKTITEAGYADNIALLANTPAIAETRLHGLERVATGISLHVDAFLVLWQGLSTFFSFVFL